MDMEKAQDFMELVGHLKHLPRAGWILRDVPSHETVAGHMYRMAMLSFLIDKETKLDQTKVMQMTLIHDLAECLVGDITPHDNIPVDKKHQMEDEAMVTICRLLGDKGSEILKLFREYEAQESPEAKYVKDLDRLDLISQAYEYEKRDKIPGELEEFFVNSCDKIRDPTLQKWTKEILTRRKNITTPTPVDH